jgi:hypothetical protein
MVVQRYVAEQHRLQEEDEVASSGFGRCYTLNGAVF